MGTVFDEDPKRWRLIAEGFTTTGRALEIATAVFPQQFVLLAGVLVSVSAARAAASRQRLGSLELLFDVLLSAEPTDMCKAGKSACSNYASARVKLSALS